MLTLPEIAFVCIIACGGFSLGVVIYFIIEYAVKTIRGHIK